MKPYVMIPTCCCSNYKPTGEVHPFLGKEWVLYKCGSYIPGYYSGVQESVRRKEDKEYGKLLRYFLKRQMSP